MKEEKKKKRCHELIFFVTNRGVEFIFKHRSLVLGDGSTKFISCLTHMTFLTLDLDSTI
jgi:hypothetical protein